MDSAALLLILLLAGLSLASNSTCRSSHTPDDKDIQYTTIEGYIDNDIFLPCFFNITLISQAECNDTAVIWSYLNTNVHLLEFKLQSSNVQTWGKWKQQRIMYDKSKNGNFSIIVSNVDLEVTGNISCTLYDGINYIMAKRILQVLIKEKDLAEDLLLPLTIGGGLLFILVAVVVVGVLKISGRRTQNCETHTDTAIYSTIICDQRVMKENEIYDKIWHD
ncbi:uncharacterized protein LOC120928680 [Rana temporaria]|uniref:uncharacterized protein LOC120928680 n=1 Tax=Rana temporaria TaxID=8407 RepID=UPI001AAE0826|nr:uncharacterized protein LOC120928680 [Rana temporaria]